MNLSKLFEIQAKLDERINEKHGLYDVDMLPVKILALQVELGELANEWRGFKFWSKRQEPRRVHKSIAFSNPGGAFEHVSYPLLEEYVDCLHFILSIGLDIEYTNIKIEPLKKNTVLHSFRYIFARVDTIEDDYKRIFDAFVGLAEHLGFTWDEVEQAYMDKNAINHRRQDNGY